MSKDFLISRAYAAESTSGRVADDTPVAMRITHIAASAITSVTLTSASSLVLIDGDGTTTVTFATSGEDTIGGVADKINGTANWRCKVLDALRSEASAAKLLPNSAITATVVNGETVYDVLVDTSAMDTASYRLTYDRNVSNAKPLGNHRVKLNKISYNWDMTAGANGIRVYKWNPTLKLETQIWGATSVDGATSTANDTSHTFTSGLSGGDGNDLIVQINSGAMGDSGVNFLQAEYTKE